MPSPHIRVDSRGAYQVRLAWWGDGAALWRDRLEVDPVDWLSFRFWRADRTSFTVMVWPGEDLPYGHGTPWADQDWPRVQWLVDYLEHLGVERQLALSSTMDPPDGLTVEGNELEAMSLLGVHYFTMSNRLLQEWAAQRWLNG